MRNILTKFSCVLFFMIFCISCSSDNSSSNGFYYYENSVGNKQKADYAYYNPGFNEISAFKSDEEILYFELPSFSVGTHPIDNASGSFHYYGTNAPVGSSFTGTGGSVIITKNENGKLSGTFTVTGSGTGSLSALSSLKGNFENLITLP